MLRSLAFAFGAPEVSRRTYRIQLRWFSMAAAVCAFILGIDAEHPMRLGPLAVDGVSLWVFWMASAWNPPGRRPWWEEPYDD